MSTYLKQLQDPKWQKKPINHPRGGLAAAALKARNGELPGKYVPPPKKKLDVGDFYV